MDLCNSVGVHLFERVSMSVGIVGTLVNTGIGSLIDDLKRNLPIASHYVTKHPLYGIDLRKRDATCVIDCLSFDDWLKERSAVIFVEQPTVADMVAKCKARGVPTLCQVDVDWFSPALPWVPDVTMFVAPNLTTFNRLTQEYALKNVAYIPAIVDTTLFPFCPRTRCDLFLFNNGWGGYKGRKGGDLIQKAARFVSGRLLVHSQAKFQVTTTGAFKVETFVGNMPDRRSLYTRGDVYLAPTRWEGYGLHILEALACGLPTLVTNGPPMSDYVQERSWLIDTESVVRRPAEGRFTPVVCTPKVTSLVAQIRAWKGRDIRQASIQARRIAMAFSWEEHGSTYLDILKGWAA